MLRSVMTREIDLKERRQAIKEKTGDESNKFYSWECVSVYRKDWSTFDLVI
jgi:hypothetical protein